MLSKPGQPRFQDNKITKIIPEYVKNYFTLPPHSIILKYLTNFKIPKQPLLLKLQLS